MDHTIVHFEIPADDPERAVSFYRKLFGWEVKKWETPPAGGGKGGGSGKAGGDGGSSGSAAGAGMEYWLISTVPTDEKGMPTRAGVNGGLMRRMQPEQRTVNYISVDSVEEFARKATGAGGRVVMPKTPVPGMGWFVLVNDTEGNTFGLWEHDEAAA